jgi:transposase InsO family protein
MSGMDDARSPAERWAHFRFSVVGKLLTAPPVDEPLKAALEDLAKELWTHPISGDQVHFEFSTIETWYYAALRAANPVEVLRKKVRCDKGTQRALTYDQREFLHGQYKDHPGWTVQLHYDNLAAAAVKNADLGPVPSYASVRRFMRRAGLHRQKKVRKGKTAGERAAQVRLETREVRSYEVERPGALWHLDFHHCSRQVLLPSGEWHTPLLLGVLDDHSRVACHLQWYLGETTEVLVHGVTQALLKHDCPASLMSDNGSAMTSAEFTQGLLRLGISHDPTLPHSPYQNAKQEAFWGNQIEGRLMPMLEGVPDLTLDQLNKATLAWMGIEYNRHYHSEIRQTPLERYLAGQDASHPAPDPEQIRFAFTAAHSRRQRASDGTISIQGHRFEVPSRFRHMKRISLRFARWDLTRVWLVDPDHDKPLAFVYPVNKLANASGQRRALEPPNTTQEEPPPSGMAPLLEQLMAEYALTGLPPAYVPFSPAEDDE